MPPDQRMQCHALGATIHATDYVKLIAAGHTIYMSYRRTPGSCLCGGNKCTPGPFTAAGRAKLDTCWAVAAYTSDVILASVDHPPPDRPAIAPTGCNAGGWCSVVHGPLRGQFLPSVKQTCNAHPDIQAGFKYTVFGLFGRIRLLQIQGLAVRKQNNIAGSKNVPHT